jgi:hypothetical protein
MESFKLEDFTASQNNSTESRLAGWELNALKAYMATLSSEKTSYDNKLWR